MTHNHWIGIKELNANYGISNRNHVHVIMNLQSPHWAKRYTSPKFKRKQIAINIGFLVRVEAFRLRLTEEAHEMFYDLVDMYGSIWQLALALEHKSGSNQACWNHWLANRLFMSRNESYTILSTKVSPKLVSFVRFGRRILKTQQKRIT